VRAWDLPTRLFHWALVTLFAFAWISHRFSARLYAPQAIWKKLTGGGPIELGDPLYTWHRWNGYAILILIVFRLLWGFVGSSTSRFRSFVRWPWTAAGYGLDLLRGRERHYLGHNPLGSYMILVLLGLVSAQGMLGLFTLEHNEVVAGPLKRIASDPWVAFLSKWHVRGFNIILAFVVIHVAANLFYQLVKRDPLITTMVTGRKPAGDYVDTDEAQLVQRPMSRALVCLAAAAAIVVGGIVALGGKLT
jgi:cytochrome b